MLVETGSPRAEWGCGGIGGWVATAAQQCSRADMDFHAGPVEVAAETAETAGAAEAAEAAGVAAVAEGVVGVVVVEVEIEEAVVV